MDSVFKIWETSRKIYNDFFDKYTLEQLNLVPPGFRNNLIWNIGHVVVAQQSLIYRLSQLPMNVPDELFARYKPGTQPTGLIAQEEADQIRSLLTSLTQRTKADFEEGKFVSFQEYNTITGFHLGSIQDAFAFVNYHEGLHYGVMMSIRKFV